MTPSIVNAAPMTIMQGTEDLSTRQVPLEPEVLPTHLAKVYIYAKSGPTTPQLVVGDARTTIYGADSFDMRLAYANHATELSNALNAQGNAQMIQRVMPADAEPPASLRVSIDLLLTTVTSYQRDADGYFLLDMDGLKQAVVPSAELSGYKAKFVVETITADTFGIGTSSVGAQTDTVLITSSTKYPLIDLEVAHFGKDGNNFGLRMWAPTSRSSQPIDDRLMTGNGVYPFRMACVKRADALSTPRVVETNYAEQFITACLKVGTIDKNTDAQVYAGDVFIQNYQNISTPGQAPQWGPFGRMYIYQNYVDTVLGMIHTKEKAATIPSGQTDLTSADAAVDKYRVNLFGGTNVNNVPYYTYEILPAGSGNVRLTETTNMYASGGTDGTMSDALFAGLVATEVAEYSNINSVLQDSAKFPESIIYDSGFPIATKRALANFISLRKDTMVVLSTHDVGGPQLSASQESSLAVALRTHLQMYPESDYFGTPCMRGMIVGRSGKRLNSQFTKPLPLTVEIAAKAARYMGAGNGRWKPGFGFDGAPNHLVEQFTDINVTFTPAPVRNKDWAAGLVWVEQYSRRQCYFPALKTVYDNDTSVLNSFFTVMAIVELQKVGERARRYFSGVSNLTNAQLVSRVNKFVEDNTVGRFDDRFVIEPDAYFTEADRLRGYSYTLRIKIYAPNMKTVMSLSIQAQRIDDLVT